MDGDKRFPGSVQKRTLAEQLANQIEELILSNVLESGATLPSEADLASQFGVSRSVVRDATRILMTKGLVEVKHGRGVFISEAQNEAFGAATLLSFRRNGVNLWEIRQLEGLLFPGIIALAITEADDDEIITIQQRAGVYMEIYTSFFSRWEEETFIPELEQQRMWSSLVEAYRSFLQAIFTATHNKAVNQLAHTILNLRHARGGIISPPPLLEKEMDKFQQFLEAIEARDGESTGQIVSDLMELTHERMRIYKIGSVDEYPFIPTLI